MEHKVGRPGSGVLERMLPGRLKGLVYGKCEISIFHQFMPPPYGGGNQFLLALRNNLQQRGHSVANNFVCKNTKACVFNSFNFDFDQLRKLARKYPQCRMVHRVDGPIGVYRGFDDGTDLRIRDINAELAQVTVFQSRFSLAKHEELGLDFVNPTVIVNAPDPAIFNLPDRERLSGSGKVRLVSVSWSDNPKKGEKVYSWLDRNLDFERYDYTFVGRTKANFRNIRTIPPLPSAVLAGVLKRSDIFITASEDDPCSNALIEAIHCGLPAVYLESGGHGELVGGGGVGFSSPHQVPGAIEQVVGSYQRYRSRARLPGIGEIADRYLLAMGLPH